MLRKVSLVLAVLLLFSFEGRATDNKSSIENVMAAFEKINKLEDRLERQDTTVTLLKSSVERLKGENAALRTLVETSQKKLESLQQENIDRKVAFSASLLASGSGQTGPFSTVNSPLIYKKVVTNYGNGYDSNTGIFTAPLKGVYFLRFYAHSHSGTRSAVSLYKNNQLQCSVYSHRPVDNGNAGNGIVLALDKGDQIYTKLWENSWVYDDAASYTSFGGFLLFPL